MISVHARHSLFESKQRSLLSKHTTAMTIRKPRAHVCHLLILHRCRDTALQKDPCNDKSFIIYRKRLENGHSGHQYLYIPSIKSCTNAIATV